jgi:hypothetical protein
LALEKNADAVKPDDIEGEGEEAVVPPALTMIRRWWLAAKKRRREGQLPPLHSPVG